MTKTFLVAVSGLAMIVSLTGCTKTLKKSSEEDLVKQVVQRGGKETKSVKCPDGVEAKKGKTFTCTTVLTDGSSYGITIKVGDKTGDNKVQLNVVKVQPTKQTTK